MDHSEVAHLKRCETCGLNHGYHTHEQWETRHDRPKVDYTPAELDEASKLLLKAAEVIERQGWCQNFIGTAGGQVCLEGALNVAAGLSPAQLIRVGMPAWEAFTRVRLAVSVSPFMWNDAEGRTKDQVVAKLRSVALGL